MAVNRMEFKLIRIFLRGVKAGIDNCLKTIQDERLAKYVLKELRKRNNL